MSVILSTYHSLDVISRAQHHYGLPPIDLVICDEAHRTTGATLPQRSAAGRHSHFERESLATNRIVADLPGPAAL